MEASRKDFKSNPPGFLREGLVNPGNPSKIQALTLLVVISFQKTKNKLREVYIILDDLHRLGNKEQQLEVQTNTPWKINGWNLQPSPILFKENDLNQTSIFGHVPAVHLQGISGIVQLPHIKRGSHWFSLRHYCHT